MKILRDIESPPGGWRITVPQTGTTITAPFAKSLRSKVLAHLVANEVEEDPDFDAWFDDTACRESGHVEPFCGNPGGPAVAMSDNQRLITPGKAKRFLKTVWGLLQTRKLVSREEAVRRAAICLDCPLAGDIGGCWSCNALMRRVNRLLKDSPVQMPDDKQFCMVCGCHYSKVWIPSAVLDAAEKDDPQDYPSNCWRLYPDEEVE